MFEPITHHCAEPFGNVVTRHVEGRIIESCYSGISGKELVQSVLDITPMLLSEVPGLCWILDMSKVTKVHSDGTVPGKEILRLFQEGGGRLFVMVVNNIMIKILINSVALTVKLPIKVFDSREKALTYLRERTN